MLDIVASFHCMQPMNQTSENGKKPSFGPDFGPFGPNSDCHFFFFFLKNLALQVTRYRGQLSWYTLSEKTNDPNLRKLSDGRTDRQMDRKTRVIS